jgi:L-alanine-DL-glutamate epimerase-like enolase superfamily enzyme
VLDVQLVDIVGHGFTAWQKLLPELKQAGHLASPHAWGNALKTNYVAHLAAGCGGVLSIEGVTCSSEDVDLGDYPLKDGKLTVSDAPGFGMKLKM